MLIYYTALLICIQYVKRIVLLKFNQYLFVLIAELTEFLSFFF